MRIKDEESALSVFEAASMAHAKATDDGDYKTANSAYKTKARATAFLKERNQIQLLSRFLIHPEIGVRISAAARLLPIMETEALSVLEAASMGSGIQRLNAEMILSEWKKGTLNL